MQGKKLTKIKIDVKGTEQEAPAIWILVVTKDDLYEYTDRNEALSDLSEVMPEHPEASLAMIYYTEPSTGGTFTVEGVSWKDIALGWLKK